MTAKRWVAACMALVLLAVSRSWSEEAPADLVLRHGAVYTVDAARSWAESVAIRDGKIAYVGPDSGVSRFVGPATKVLELHGKMVMPGFCDSHVHPVVGGVDLGQCLLDGAKTAPQVYDLIRQYARAHPDKKWIVGGGWDLPLFPQANPTLEQLDRLVPDRPAYLEAADGHSAWFNTRAKKVCGLSRSTPDPPHGRIERDRRGEPTGTVREAAMDLVKKHVPKPTAVENEDGLRRALKMASRFGITAVQEAHAEDDVLEAWHALDQKGELTVTVTAALDTDLDKDETQVAAMVEKRSRFAGPRLHPTSAKIFADGVIETHTAALLAPYTDRRDDRGHLNLSPERFNRLVARLEQEGFQVHVHAIGDRAVRTALDAFSWARKMNGPRDARPIIAHLELVDPQDVPRFRDLGIVANFEPLWALEDNYIRDLTIPFVGPERSRRLYPIGTMVRSGAVVCGGSDWDVTSMNPLEAIQVAITRAAPGDRSGPPMDPEERIDLPTAIAMYTIAGAYANHREREAGSIEPGKAADLIVLDRNLFAIPATAIHHARVLLTLVEGKEVFREKALTGSPPK